MARKTVYNNITTPELLTQINEENTYLMKEFIDYLKSIDRAKTTIYQYEQDLNIFWVWNLQNNNNKEFIKITKREFAKFQNYAINEWQWSPKRTRRVKSVLSSLSNFIENILDEEEEYEGYRSVIKKIENPVNETVREKTVFEPEEIQNLLDYLVENEQYMKACVLALAYSSGRRKAELPRFKVSYFTDENVIFGSLYKTPEKVVTKGRGSKGKLLYLYVLKNQFDPYLKLWLEEREKLGITSEWLFPLKVGNEWDNDNQMNISTMDSWTDGFTKFLGKDFYWHSLRHLYTTSLSENNIPSNVIQEIVGWDSADMVNLYTDTSTDDLIGKYFNEDGIVQVEQSSLSDL